jgi:hypothetical protein
LLHSLPVKRGATLFAVEIAGDFPVGRTDSFLTRTAGAAKEYINYMLG